MRLKRVLLGSELFTDPYLSSVVLHIHIEQVLFKNSCLIVDWYKVKREQGFGYSEDFIEINFAFNKQWSH